jgi:hypothetical protein
VSDPSKPSVEISEADFRAVRYLAGAWGAVIAGTWLFFDDARVQLLMTAVQLALLALSLLAIYWLRRWKGRRDR